VVRHLTPTLAAAAASATCVEPPSGAVRHLTLGHRPLPLPRALTESTVCLHYRWSLLHRERRVELTSVEVEPWSSEGVVLPSRHRRRPCSAVLSPAGRLEEGSKEELRVCTNGVTRILQRKYETRSPKPWCL